jgi:3'-phosphoadenosine 5'-phosphosulfate sulfotransferase (PAPS reductase)/FAD synthetase
MKHVGAISGGKDSTAMAVLLTEQHPEIEFVWICTPTGNEPPEWYAHMRRLRGIIGPIYPVMVPGGLDGLIRDFEALPNWRQRWCTRMLKIEPFAAYLTQAAPAKFYVGLRADEEQREGGDYTEVAGVEMVFPLREADMGLSDVYAFLLDRNIEVPRRTDCMLCFFQKLIEWHELWRTHPDAYEMGEEYEEMTGFTFRSPGRDVQPTSLKALREKFETGWVPRETRSDPMKEMQCRVCRL